MLLDGFLFGSFGSQLLSGLLLRGFLFGLFGSCLLLLDFVKFKRQPARTQNVS